MKYCEGARNRSQKTAIIQFLNEENIFDTKIPTNLPTLRLNFTRFLRLSRVTRNEDICDCCLISKQKVKNSADVTFSMWTSYIMCSPFCVNLNRNYSIQIGKRWKKKSTHRKNNFK